MEGTGSKVEASDDMYFTVTMAEVLEAQGRLEDALAIYTFLFASRPDDKSLGQSVQRLKQIASKGSGSA